MTEPEYAALTALLTAEVEALTGICEAAAAQRAALLQADSQAVLAAVAAGDSHARKLRSVETERTALMPPGSTQTLAGLVAAAPEPYRTELQRLRHDAGDLLAQIKADNEANQQLADTCLRFCQRYLGALRDRLGAGTGYAQVGRKAPGRPSGLLDRQA